METITLGRSGMQVSPICFGTWQLGGDWGGFGEEEAIAAIRRARDIGINFFDTAQGYGFGASERLLARALGDDIRADDVVVATKGGLRPEGDGIVRDSSPEWVRQGVEESLLALGVEQIDLYQIHWPDPDVPFARTAEMLDELVQEGKIAHVGVSNFDSGHLAAFERSRGVETLQPPYHLFRRDAEAATLPYCEEHDIGVLVYGPLAHGLLTGTMSKETSFGDDDWRSSSPMFDGEEFRTNLDRVAELQRFATDRGWTVGQLAIAWVLSHPAVDVAIVGTRSPDHIAESAQAADIRLTEGDRGEIDEIMKGAVQVEGPSPEAA